MIARQPAGEITVSTGPAGGVDLQNVRMIHGELEYQTVGVGEVERPAVSVVGNHHHLESGVLRSSLDRLLLLGRDEHREVPEERESRCRCELFGELAVGELEECETPSVSELVHRVAELLLFAPHQVLDLCPCGDKGYADDVLVEFSGGLLIGGNESVVV